MELELIVFPGNLRFTVAATCTVGEFKQLLTRSVGDHKTEVQHLSYLGTCLADDETLQQAGIPTDATLIWFMNTPKIPDLGIISPPKPNAIIHSNTQSPQRSERKQGSALQEDDLFDSETCAFSHQLQQRVNTRPHRTLGGSRLDNTDRPSSLPTSIDGLQEQRQQQQQQQQPLQQNLQHTHSPPDSPATQHASTVPHLIASISNLLATMHDGTITPSHSGMISTLSTKQSLAARQISQTALITAVHQLFVKPGSHTPLSHSTEALLLALLTDCLPSSSPSTSVAVTPTPGSQTTGQGIPSSLAAGANDTGNVADLERHIPLVLTALSELLSRSRTHFVQLPLFVDGMTSMLDASPSAFHNMQQQQQRSHAESPTEPTPDMLLQSQRATTADSLLLFSDIITAQAAVLLETGRLSTAISALLTGDSGPLESAVALLDMDGSSAPFGRLLSAQQQQSAYLAGGLHKSRYNPDACSRTDQPQGRTLGARLTRRHQLQLPPPQSLLAQSIVEQQESDQRQFCRRNNSRAANAALQAMLPRKTPVADQFAGL